MTSIHCVFCGDVAPRAKEHVFPDWLLQLLDAADEKIPLRHSQVDGTVVSERQHPLSQFRYGHVCGGCNHGHLSRLEGEAKRIFRGLWADRVALSAVDAFALSIWTLKTAVMLNAASNYRRIIDPAHARAVSAMYPPDGLFLHLAFQSRATKVSWVQSQNLSFRGVAGELEAPIDEFRRRGFNVAFCFGGVLLRLVYLPVVGFTVRSLPGTVRQSHLIWPRRTSLRLDRGRQFESAMEFSANAMGVDRRDAA